VQGERRDRVPDDIKGCWIGFPQCDLRKAPTFCLHYAAPNRELWRLWDSLLWDGMQRQDPRGCCGIGGHRPVPLVWAGTAFAAGFHGALAPVVAFVGRCERHPRGPRSGVSVGELPSSGVVVSSVGSAAFALREIGVLPVSGCSAASNTSASTRG
jgi:hypothetical protein